MDEAHIERIEKMVFKTFNNQNQLSNCCFLALTKTVAVTVFNGEGCLHIGDIISLERISDPNTKIEVKITRIGHSYRNELVYFETLNDSEFEYFSESAWNETIGMPYHSIGIHSETRSAYWKSGTILRKDSRTSHLLITSEGVQSGRILFDKYGRLFGIAEKRYQNEHYEIMPRHVIYTGVRTEDEVEFDYSSASDMDGRSPEIKFDYDSPTEEERNREYTFYDGNSE